MPLPSMRMTESPTPDTPSRKDLIVEEHVGYPARRSVANQHAIMEVIECLKKSTAIAAGF